MLHQIGLMFDVVAAEDDVEPTSRRLIKVAKEVNPIRTRCRVEPDLDGSLPKPRGVKDVHISNVRPTENGLAERADLHQIQVWIDH
jgi:hypothetical protein